MKDVKKLDYVHHVLQETGNGHVDLEMVEQALEYIEELREPLIEDDNTETDEWGNKWDTTLAIEVMRQRMEKFND